jgi:hypothetical protein
MKITDLGQGRAMFELSLDEIHHRAGIGPGDSDMEADMKFSHWIGKKQYRVIDINDYEKEAPKAQADGIEVLIVKGKQNVSKS